MQADITAIQYLGMVMSSTKLHLDYVLSMVEILNHSYLSCKDIVAILEDIFKNEKSARILVATQVLQYLIKNCNRNFHQAANRESFQKSILGLLKRQRGKMSLLKQIRSNTENWSKIQSKILYLVQLWYDAFILEEGKYKHIINNYKLLRKENIIFPPRNVNEKSLLAVQTQSPIFQNIQTISQTDHQKFNKKLRAMGLGKLSEKFQKQTEVKFQKQVQPKFKQVNIDEISQKIAIIQSQSYEVKDVLKIIEQIKRDIQFGKVKKNQQQYWKEVKEAAQLMIRQWEEKNAQLIKQQQMKYLQGKLGKQKKKEVEVTLQQPKKPIIQNNEVDLLGDFQVKEEDQPKHQQQPPKQQQQVNLLDL